jgi:5-methylcytosine-specific restriction endonuclease McrA
MNKKCCDCNILKSCNEFAKAHYKDGLDKRCKSCKTLREHGRLRFLDTSEKDRTKNCSKCSKSFIKTQRNQKYCSKECCYTSQKYNPSNGRFKIFQRDFFTCIYCGRNSLKHSIELHMDHIVAKNKGGLDVASNLVTAWKDCNLQKLDMTMNSNNLENLLTEVANRNKRENILGNLEFKDFQDKQDV